MNFGTAKNPIKIAKISKKIEAIPMVFGLNLSKNDKFAILNLFDAVQTTTLKKLKLSLIKMDNLTVQQAYHGKRGGISQKSHERV